MTAEDDTPTVPAPAPATRPPRRRALRKAAALTTGIVACTGIAVAGCIGAVSTMWSSESGTRWLLQHLPGVTAVDVRGSFGGGDLRIGSLRALESGTQVDIAALHVSGLRWRWRPHPGTWLGLSFDRWDADTVDVRSTPGKTTSATHGAPTSLRSPVALDVALLHIGALTIGGGAPLRDVRATLALGTEQGRLHRVDHLSFGWERVQAEGSLMAQTDAPLRIDVALTAHDVSDAGPGPGTGPGPGPSPAALHWSASATLRGPLAGFDAAASLQGQARPGRAAPQAQASAHVTPFAALPVSSVLLKTAELDLSALSASAPTTRLQGSVHVATTRPAAVDIDLRNLAPAAWSDGGLPFSALTAQLAAPWDGAWLAVPALRVTLADAQGSAGELRAQGRWEGHGARLQLDLDQVQTARLDTHLGAWRIGGPLHADFDRLPLPASLWGGASGVSSGTASSVSSPASSESASAASSASSSAAPSADTSRASPFASSTVHVTGHLHGEAPSPGPARNTAARGPAGVRTPEVQVQAQPQASPVDLQLDALLGPDTLQLKKFDVKAGAASIVAQGALRHADDGRWQGQAHAQWTQLDPGAWWRLADSGPLRTGATLLNGMLALQLTSAPASWQGLDAIRGRVDATLASSQLAGLPLEGKASLDASRAPWTLDAELHSAANQSRLSGTLAPGHAASPSLAVIERLHLSVDAPDLNAFAPLSGARAVSTAATAAGAAPSPADLPADVPASQRASSPTSPGAALSASLQASAAARPARPASQTIPGELIGKAATKVATGGKTTDTRALAPALAPAHAASAPRMADARPAGSLESTATIHGAAHFELDVTGGHLAIADTAPSASHAAAPLKIVTHGELSDWSGPASKLSRLQWSGAGSSDPQAPLTATISLVDGQWGASRVSRADATLSGTLADHRLQLQAEAPVSPPLWLAHLANIADANATRLDGLLQGHWRPDARDAPAWQGHLAQLDLRAVSAVAVHAVAGSAGATRGAMTAGTTPAGPAARPVATPAATSATPASPAGDTAWVHLQPFDLSASRDAADHWQTLRIGAGGATFAGLTLNWQPSYWTAASGSSTSGHWAFDAALAPFSVAQLLARAQPDLGWHGDLKMNATLHAAFDGQWHVDGQLARTGGDLSVSDLAQDPTSAKQALGLTTVVARVKAEGAAWQASTDIAGTRLGELSGLWQAQADAPDSLPGLDSPLHGNVKAHVADLNVWGAWLPPGWRLGGELRTDLALSGRWRAPQVSGDITAQRLVVRNALEGVYGHDGELAVRLTGDQARIDRFKLVGGNGTLSATGSASLGATPTARLQVQATQFQLLGRIDRKLVASGNMDLQLGADAIKVDGKLRFDEGLFDLTRGGAPTLDSDVEVLDPTNAAASATDDAAAAVPKTGRATAIALDIDLGDHLQLRGRGIDTTLKGALQITSPNGQLAVHGGVRTVGGQYTAYGQKLQVARGEVTFTGPVNDPRLDILATRPNLDVVVGVAITGTALAPRVKLTSDPEMSDSDKLSWLMLGRAPDTVGGADTALLQQAAIALLAGEDEAPTDQLLKRLGLTDFAFRQQTDANDVRQTVVSLGRQVSRRVYVGYERGVNATAGNWQLIYRIAQRLTVRAQSGEDNSVDAIYTWRWN